MPKNALFLANSSHRWKVLGIGVAANASFSAVFQGIPTTAVFMRADYKFTNSELGLVLGLLGLGIALSELPWGLLTDRWGDRRVLLLGLLTTAIALLIMTLFAVPTHTSIPGWHQLAIGMACVGILGGSVNGASGRAIMTWFREGERGLAMSIRQTAVPLGGGFGALALPLLASRFGFIAVYGLLAALCAITAFFTWRWVFDPISNNSEPQNGTKPAAANRYSEAQPSPLKDMRIWRIVLGIGILCGPQFAILTFATVFMHDFTHSALATVTTVMLSIQLGAMGMRVWSGRWTDRRGNRKEYLRACAILSVIAFILLACGAALLSNGAGADSSTMTGIVILLLVLAGICVSAWHGVAYAELASLAGASRAGTALGMGNTCVFVVLFLTPISIPAILSVGPWSAVWLACAGCALVALPLFPRPPHVRAVAREGLT
jgi:MFS family permease